MILMTSQYTEIGVFSQSLFHFYGGLKENEKPLVQ